MSYIQMKDILKTMKSISLQMIDAYEDLKEEVADEAVKHCLHQAICQEQKLVQSLQEYLETAPDKVLKVWFQSPGVGQLKETVKMVEEAEVETLEDALNLVVDCDKILLSVYQNLAGALSADIRDVFEHLRTVRLQSDRNWVWQYSRPRA